MMAETDDKPKRRRRNKPVGLARAGFCQETQDAICEAIAENPNLEALCRDPRMPPRRQIEREMDRDEAFRARFRMHRMVGYMRLADEILELSDGPCANITQVNQRRLQVDTRKWLLSKTLPRIFGEKVLVGSDPDNPPPPQTDIQRDYEELRQKFQAKLAALNRE